MRRRSGRAPLPAGFGVVWTSVAIDLVGFGIVFPVLPFWAKRFGATPATFGILVASYSLAQLVFSPLWGRLSDRVGRKPVLIVSLAGTAVGSLVMGLAPALWVLFLGRVLDGISGASISVAQASVVDVAAPDQRARLLGLLGAAFGVGFVAGPAIGGLASLGGEKLPFFLAAALAGVNAIVAVRRLPETNPRHVPADPAVAPPAGARSWWSSDVRGLLVLAFLAMTAFSAFEATFAFFGERRLGLEPWSTAAVFAAIGIVLVGVQVALIHPVVARFGEETSLRLGLAANAVGLLLLADVDSWWQLPPSLLLLVVGQGLVVPTLSSTVAGRAAPDRRGGVLGVQQSVGALARVVGPAAGGFAFDHVGVPAPFVAGAVVMAVCALFAPSGARLEVSPAP